jgi:amylosucrase
VRSHDDIGWTFSDDDARNVGINGYDHRNFLNRFYSGAFAGGFAKGVRFQYNPQNGDMRVCGTTASLAGIENALELNDEGYLRDASQRIVLLYGLTMCLGGIPLLYLGDEIGMTNDYSFNTHPEKAHDSRWVHRPKHNWQQVEALNLEQSVHNQLFRQLKQLISIRKNIAAFGTNSIELVETGSPSVLGFMKKSAEGNVFILANFSEHTVRTSPLLVQQALYEDLISGETKKGFELTVLEPYALKWIRV